MSHAGLFPQLDRAFRQHAIQFRVKGDALKRFACMFFAEGTLAMFTAFMKYLLPAIGLTWSKSVLPAHQAKHGFQDVLCGNLGFADGHGLGHGIEAREFGHLSNEHQAS